MSAIQSLEDLWAEFVAWEKKFFSHPDVQAATVTTPVQPVVTAVPTTPAVVTVPGSTQQISGVMAAILGVNQKTSDILNSRVGQSADQVTLDPSVIYYNHNTFVKNGSYTTEELHGPTVVKFTYTSQDGTTGPTKGSFYGSDGSKVEDMQLGVGTVLPLLATSGKVTITAKMDSDGRVIGQLGNP